MHTIVYIHVCLICICPYLKKYIDSYTSAWRSRRGHIYHIVYTINRLFKRCSDCLSKCLCVSSRISRIYVYLNRNNAWIGFNRKYLNGDKTCDNNYDREYCGKDRSIDKKFRKHLYAYLLIILSMMTEAPGLIRKKLLTTTTSFGDTPSTTKF